MNVIISLSGYIEDTTEFFIRMVDAICDPKYSSIIVLIDSPGGNTNSITPIVESFKLAKTCGKEVITVGLGTIASSAASIFVAGDRRILFPNAEFLIHSVSISSNGKDSIVGKELKQLYERTISATDVVMNNIIKSTKLTPEIVEQKIAENKDWFLTAEEIKEYGITTEDYSVETLKEIFVDDSNAADRFEKALAQAGFNLLAVAEETSDFGTGDVAEQLDTEDD